MSAQVHTPATLPARKREQLARPLLQIVREAFNDPAIQAEFENWKKRKKEKEQNEHDHH